MRVHFSARRADSKYKCTGSSFYGAKKVARNSGFNSFDGPLTC